MNNQDDLIEEISKAFSKNSLPPLDKIYLNERVKIEYADLLGTKSWKEISLERLKFRDDVIVSLSLFGFIYYLPAFLRFLLLDYEDTDVLGDAVIERLTPQLNDLSIPRQSWVNGLYSHLSAEQKISVRNVLLFLNEKYDDGCTDLALNDFWLEETHV